MKYLGTKEWWKKQYKLSDDMRMLYAVWIIIAAYYLASIYVSAVAQEYSSIPWEFATVIWFGFYVLEFRNKQQRSDMYRSILNDVLALQDRGMITMNKANVVIQNLENQVTMLKKELELVKKEQD